MDENDKNSNRSREREREMDKYTTLNIDTKQEHYGVISAGQLRESCLPSPLV